MEISPWKIQDTRRHFHVEGIHWRKPRWQQRGLAQLESGSGKWPLSQFSGSRIHNLMI